MNKIANKNKPLFHALVVMLLWGSLFPMVKLGYVAYNISSTVDVLFFAGVRTKINPTNGTPLGEIDWGGAAGGNVLIDVDNNISFFYAHHMLNNQESYVQPRLRDILYNCIK